MNAYTKCQNLFLRVMNAFTPNVLIRISCYYYLSLKKSYNLIIRLFYFKRFIYSATQCVILHFEIINVIFK